MWIIGGLGLLISSVLISQCDSAKILVGLPLGAKSHHYVYQPLIRELVKRGHDVTFITSIPLGVKAPNLREITIPNGVDEFMKNMTFDVVKKFGGIPIFRIIGFWPIGAIFTEDCLKHPEIQKLINSDSETFDLIMIETHFGQESLLGFGHKFNAPVISLGTFGTFNFMNEFFGTPQGISYLPSFDLPYTNKMTVLQRLHNTIRTISVLLMGNIFYLPYQDMFVMRKYFKHEGSENMPSIKEMLREVALVFVNSQISVDYAKPLVPNVIPVGGLHIANTTKPLPQDLKNFLDKSDNGVIYFSFGSVVPSHDLPVEIRNSFLNAFKKVKQNVLWKLPVDSLPDLPSNIKLSKWLPQQDILAHPNVRAFITHGGLLSQLEAVYHAVPQISIAFFGDQYTNVAYAAQAGYAVRLHLENITEDSVTWALNEVLINPSYKINAVKHSKIFRDNPQTPLEKAVYWTEYVIRHKGAPHLSSEGRHLSYVKYLLLDVVALLCTIIFVVIAVLYKILKYIYSFIRSKKTTKQSTVKLDKKKN